MSTTTTTTTAEDLRAKVLESFPAAAEAKLNAILASQSIVPHAFRAHRVNRHDAIAAPYRNGRPTYLRPTRRSDPEAVARTTALQKLYCESYPNGTSPMLTMRSCARAHSLVPHAPLVPNRT